MHILTTLVLYTGFWYLIIGGIFVWYGFHQLSVIGDYVTITAYHVGEVVFLIVVWPLLVMKLIQVLVNHGWYKDPAGE